MWILPGGTVYESEELYQKLKEYKETTKRPIWALYVHIMRHQADKPCHLASDKIYAGNFNTTIFGINRLVITSG